MCHLSPTHFSQKLKETDEFNAQREALSSSSLSEQFNGKCSMQREMKTKTNKLKFLYFTYNDRANF